LQLLDENNGPDVNNEGGGGGDDDPHSISPEPQSTPDLEIKEEEVPAEKLPDQKATVISI
jgi:hypothetical protein